MLTRILLSAALAAVRTLPGNSCLGYETSLAVRNQICVSSVLSLTLHPVVALVDGGDDLAGFEAAARHQRRRQLDDASGDLGSHLDLLGRGEDGRLQVLVAVTPQSAIRPLETVMAGLGLRCGLIDLATLGVFNTLRLDGRLSYLHTEVLDYETIDPTDVENMRLRELCRFQPENCFLYGPGQTVDYSGNTLPRSPEWSVTLGAEYTFYLRDWGSLTPRVQYYWQDDTYYRAFNTPLDLQEKYHQTDLKLIWRSPSEQWEAELFVNNLEDDMITSLFKRGWTSWPFTWTMPSYALNFEDFRVSRASIPCPSSGKHSFTTSSPS